MHPLHWIRRTLHYSSEPSHAPGISRARLRWESDIGNSHPLRVIETRRGWLFSGWIYIRWFRHRYLKNTTSMRSKLFSNAECVWREHKMNIFPWQRTRPAPMDRDSRKHFIRNELSSLQRLKHSILFNFEPTSKEPSQMPPLMSYCTMSWWSSYLKFYAKKHRQSDWHSVINCTIRQYNVTTLS